MIRFRSLWATGLAAVLLFGGVGCSVVDSLLGSDNSTEPAVTHHHFEDVKVPSDLKIDRSESFVFESGGFKAGTLVFSGYVEPDSLMDFFKAGMPQDGWRLKSIFRHPKTVLLFEKEKKNCIIVIYEKTIPPLTYVEVWVAPQL